MKHTTKSPDETYELAQKFARDLKPGDVLALVGDLGAGKTCFIQGLAEGLSVPSSVYVRSPSFALINEYLDGRLSLFHIDFYRLNESTDLTELGLDEYIYGEGVVAIEWADNFPKAIPKHARYIRFEIVDDGVRNIDIV